MKYLSVLGFICFIALASEAQTLKSTYKEQSNFTSENFFVGHSLTQTAYTLKKGQTMAGTFAMATGLTDSLTVATSPWLLGLYNMPNVIVRTKVDLDKNFALGLQGGYMKTQEYLQNSYQMEASYFNALLSFKISRQLTTHLQLNTMNFINDERPFSIRVSKPTKPLQVSVSMLNEISIFKKYKNELGVGIELGRIGVNEILPYNHLGFSLFRKVNGILVQLGVSISATPSVGLSDLAFIGSESLPSGPNFKKIVTHPEFQLQWFF